MQNGKLYLSQDEVIVFLWLHEEIKITCRESQAAAAAKKRKRKKLVNSEEEEEKREKKKIKSGCFELIKQNKDND